MTITNFGGTRREMMRFGLATLLGAAAVGRIGGAPAASAQDGAPAFPALPELPAAAERAGGPLQVAATTTIVADLVAQIGGGRVQVVTIMPPNADPHDFEPAPQDLAAVEGAAIVFAIGLGFDAATTDLIAGAAPDATLVFLSDGVEAHDAEHAHGAEAEAEEEGDDHDHDDDHGAVDPHIWFDPTLVVTMVATVGTALMAADPEGAPDYLARLTAYQANLATLDQEIAARVALVPAEQRKLITNHDAIAYYAERYGLEIVGTVIPGLDTRSEPSAKEIADLIETIEAGGVRVIFAENTVGAGLAEELAAQAGIEMVDTLYTDSLGVAGSGAETYIAMMQMNTLTIVDALLAAGA